MAGTVRDPHDYFFGEILHLEPADRHPDHYSLLGLVFFDQDLDRIRQAGSDRKRVLRAAPGGTPEYEHVRNELVARVKEARRVLLTPELRASYDAQLTGGETPVSEEPDFRLSEGVLYAERFRILKVTRKGGFGHVYAVLDSDEGKRGELTILSPTASIDPVVRSRAEAAARNLRLLSSARHLSPTGSGDEEGLFHLRWPWPEGVDLAHYVRRQPHGRVGVEATARIADKIAIALEEVHAAGLVHGDLVPRNVFVQDDGSVQIAECGLATAVCAEGDVPASPYSAPERTTSAAADRYALGALTYFLLSGEAPFLDGGRALVPKPLPDDVPVPMARTVLGLLAREPSQRSESPRFLARASVRGAQASWSVSRNALIGGAVFVVLMFAVLVGLFGSGDQEDNSPTARAWALIADRKFEAAVAVLDDASVGGAVLGSALGGEAHRLEQAHDPWSAQRLLERAAKVAPDGKRSEQLQRLRAELIRRLELVEVSVAGVAKDAVVFVKSPDSGLAAIVLDGHRHDAADRIPLQYDSLNYDEGEHEIAFRLEDCAGNVRDGSLRFAIDRTPPTISITEPIDGTMQRDGTVNVVVSIDDSHAPETVTIHGRIAPITGGEARLGLRLANGTHKLIVRAVDRAGNESTAETTITVDDRAPSIELKRTRIVTRESHVTILGQVTGIGVRLAVDGNRVELTSGGAFVARVPVDRDGTIRLVATGATGVVQVATIDCVFDRDPPSVTAQWPRTDNRGRFFYGTREMDAGGFDVQLVVKDNTAVRFVPQQGTVTGTTWRLPAHEGERTATLTAIDEAGNETKLHVELAGHRAMPKLTVSCPIVDLTRERRVTLSIESNFEVTVNGKRSLPGRIELPLREGNVTLDVRAIDPYGNEARWTRKIRVDRTPPSLRIVGPVERGVGRQRVSVEADEDLESITCFSTTLKMPGQTATFETNLEDGRTQLHAVARDLAGNTTRTILKLLVVNKVLLLDGKSGVRVSIPRMASKYTVEFWALGIPVVDPAVMVSRGSDRGWQIAWASADEAFPHVLFHLAKDGPDTIVAKKETDASEWHHYAMIHSGKKLRFYIDGRLQGVRELKTEITSETRELLIGGAELDNKRNIVNGFIGRIDELRVTEGVRYERAFRPKRFFAQDERTKLLMRFDVMVDDKHPDASGNGLSGTAVGTAKILPAE